MSGSKTCPVDELLHLFLAIFMCLCVLWPGVKWLHLILLLLSSSFHLGMPHFEQCPLFSIGSDYTARWLSQTSSPVKGPKQNIEKI